MKKLKSLFQKKGMLVLIWTGILLLSFLLFGISILTGFLFILAILFFFPFKGIKIGFLILGIIVILITIIRIIPIVLDTQAYGLRVVRICPLKPIALLTEFYYKDVSLQLEEAERAIQGTSSLKWAPSIELKPAGVRETHFQIAFLLCSIKIFVNDKMTGDTQRLTLDNAGNYLESIDSKDEAQKLSFLLDFISKGQTGKIVSSNEEVKEIKTCSSSEINSGSITCYLPEINVKIPGTTEERDDYFVVYRFEEDCESSVPRVIYQFSYKIFRDGRIEKSKCEKVTNFKYHCIY